MNTLTVILLMLMVLAAGVAMGWYIARLKFTKHPGLSQEEFSALQQEKKLADLRALDLRQELDERKNETAALRAQATSLSVDLSRMDTLNKGLTEKLDNQKSELDEMHKKIREQFENIASKIIFDNSKMIQQQHSEKLTDILSPLKEKIEKFENTVNVTHKENIRENQSLKEQLRLLQDLNKSIGEEARNLTVALKGQVKTQGNWGEVILETILQKSGLVKDREYFVQSSMISEDGRRMQPDILIKLPDNKTIIIDAKVSLVSYERYCSLETDAEKEVALKEHISSIRRHIRGLGEKKYQQLYEINSLDFVLLFIPIEPAFSAAIQHDGQIFNEAFESNIVIVSTSTLLATLRTIASIWKLEYQNKNAIEIARQSGALYDKFVGLLVDFEKIGDNLNSSYNAWEQAKKKLGTGKGNLITSVQKLKTLGANASKIIPGSMINDTEENDNEVTDQQALNP